MIRVHKWPWLLSASLFVAGLSLGQSQNIPRNETIAYEHGLDGAGHNILLDTDIYSANADGSNVKALTHNARLNRLLAWSPDGRQIAFESSGLQIMDRDGRNAREVPLDAATVSAGFDDGKHVLQGLHLVISSASWRPDKTLAVTFGDPFLRPDGVHVYPTFLVEPNGAIYPRPIFSDMRGPRWSPDGRKIVFATLVPDARFPGQPFPAIYTANADGSMRRQLTSPNMLAGSPVWSPDRKQIAFAMPVSRPHLGVWFPPSLGWEQIFVMNEDGSGIRQLTSDPQWEMCNSPSWSPDGQQIAFYCRAAGSCPAGAPSVPSPNWTWTCTRRIFVLSVRNPSPKLAALMDQDGTNPQFAPRN